MDVALNCPNGYENSVPHDFGSQSQDNVCSIGTPVADRMYPKSRLLNVATVSDRVTAEQLKNANGMQFKWVIEETKQIRAEREHTSVYIL